ncbi:MAG TPA: biotin transporter BioY [Candidatus Acidoferrum sp.]|jgi:biotin transport system substrate-specific component|nr:biotin transporter BioY [Candidatus Acidoferrum sp.]
MAKAAMQTLSASQERVLEGARQVALVVGGSLVVALCARVTIPLPGTPVPLTVQNFGVLLVGLLLGSRRGFAALALYLAEGAMGMPVFSPTGPGGIAQLLGPTGGFLVAYPLVAWVAGFIMERGRKSFARAAIGGLFGEVVLFIGGLGWLAVLTHSVAQAFRLGLYWFLFAEVIKVMMAAGIAAGWQRRSAQK